MGSYCSSEAKFGKSRVPDVSTLEAIADRLRIHSIRSTNAAGSGQREMESNTLKQKEPNPTLETNKQQKKV
ncbi:hypothetical protein CDAR_371411 [Caerostris darwini]|uniref:Uncharacterized protein n=1 Tax=Caerostris darwini TaxID=1538125 RepID=A0AAV4U4U9_9ARAC|nr:hypothetical protein CDAR_371411 [Caerostris darwini]